MPFLQQMCQFLNLPIQNIHQVFLQHQISYHVLFCAISEFFPQLQDNFVVILLNSMVAFLIFLSGAFLPVSMSFLYSEWMDLL